MGYCVNAKGHCPYKGKLSECVRHDCPAEVYSPNEETGAKIEKVDENKMYPRKKPL